MAMFVRFESDIAIFTLCLMMGLSNSAFANGDAFFRFDVYNQTDTPLEEQTIYAGNVKDVDGNYIEDVTITVGITVPTLRGDRRVTYNAYSNIVGRYRSSDVASVILAMEDIEHDVNPRDVEVSVSKEGYKVVRRLDRSRYSQRRGVFEIDFLLARTEESDD